MSIRLKIILIVLPLIVASIVLAGMSSYFVAASAVTRVTTEFLSFKASELEKYAEGQWNLLADNGLVGRPDMESAARAAVESFARSIVRSRTEAIIALDAGGTAVMRAGPETSAGSAEILDGERSSLALLAAKGKRGFGMFRIGGIDRVASYFPFRSFGWLVLVTEEKRVFYGDVESIFRSSLAILAGAAALAVLLLLLLARYITKPLEEVSQAMRRIIASNDLSERVPVEYNDEIGQLSHTFNLMLGELGKAYEQIKHYAFDAVVAQKKETKIRNIFQLYVPKDVIETYFQNPESMLVGNNRPVAVLFSDIRSFTTISEGMEPDDLVSSLNRYFAAMVDVIMDHGGVVDKYIGDAIMAMFGAPTKHDDDVLRSVLSGLEMIEALEAFNAGQREGGKPIFRIGVGINYGVVTVGNIGCEKKMNYTLIGDPVNLASRLEGATKMYKQPILVSQDVYDRVKDSVRCRQIDRIQVKGKTEGVSVYTARSALAPAEEKAWAIHADAMSAYYRRDFPASAKGFREILSILPDDYPASILLGRSEAYEKTPPPADWDGVEVLTEK
jgi:class 3 adenylate cyclase/HAMP domain-containing protein